MKVHDLVYKVCEHEAKTITEDIMHIDKNVISPTSEYIETIYRNLLHKANFEITQEKIVIHRAEFNEPLDNASWLNLDIYDGCWIYATKTNENESLIILKYCEQRNSPDWVLGENPLY